MRQRTRVFSELRSHYVFADRFGRPGKGNDKGKVEGLIGWARRNLPVPVPRAASPAALNEQLLEGCRRRLGDRLRGHDETIEARDEKRLLRLQRQLAACKLPIIDELGYLPLSTTGAELLFEVFSQRYERGSTLVTSNLPFDEWTGVFGSERLAGALLDRPTHHVHILEMNADSYRLKQSKQRQRPA